MQQDHLDTLLTTVREVKGLARVFAFLGYSADMQPFEQNWIVARWGGCVVLAGTGTPAIGQARALARRLGALAWQGLAVAVDDAGEIAIAAPRIGVVGTTPVLRLPPRATPPDAIRLLRELAPRPNETGLALALRVNEVLTSERVGDRFFLALRAVLERMAVSLRPRGSAAERRTAALIALTRVLFLYFVQAKGWLDGQPHYLRALLERALSTGKHFHRAFLSPLFFGTLNREAARRSPRLRLGNVPYLNGGLFEPHPVERRLAPVTFGNSLWRDAFEQVFDRFRFCPLEADEADAIAPDMLGRVFERVMEPDERQDTGTFYTPARVVKQLVSAAIEVALAGQEGLTRAAARRIVTETVTDAHEALIAARALAGIRLLDPAAGSGAFLLGALERLTALRVAVTRPRPVALPRLRRDILRENLFGVDVSPIAVRLAELRLWLALIADDPTTDLTAVAPLPNLDGVLRQGDSLFDPLSASRALGFDLQPEQARGIPGARAAVFETRGTAHASAARRLQAAEHALATSMLADARSGVDAALRDLAGAASGRDLFGRRSGLDPRQRMRYRTLREHRAALRRAAADIADGALPFFAFEVHTPDIVAHGGFTIVVGNPPWVRAERLPPGRRRALARRFSWWQAAHAPGFAHLPDLAIAFLQRGLELTRPGGVVAMLVPSKLISAGYGESARRQLVRETTLEYLHRLPPRDAAAFDATTYPLALVAKKQPPAERHRVFLDLNRTAATSQRSLGGAGPWILVPDRQRAALTELVEAGQPLGRMITPSLGVKTGADAIFLGTLMADHGAECVVRLANQNVTLESALVRPALRGRDLRPFHARPTRVVLWPYHNREVLKALPAAAARYLHPLQARLRRRADYLRGPVWQLFRVTAACGPHRVVWPDIARRPRAVALDATPHATAVPLNSCYVLNAPDEGAALALAAVLNSTWAAVFATTIADQARGRYHRINAGVVGRLPLPQRLAGATAIIELSRRYHQDHHVEQHDLDAAVADAYGLTPSTRRALQRMAGHQG